MSRVQRHARLSLLLLAGVLAALLGIEFARTAPVRQALRSYLALNAAARQGDLDTAERLCTVRYRRLQPLRSAPEGGLVGLPRNIHPNHQAWRDGSDVLICPANRIGPVYRFRKEAGSWKFDGAAGMLEPGGRFFPISEPDSRNPIMDEPGGLD